MRHSDLVGDDINDEPVFERTAQLADHQSRQNRSSSAARFYLDSPNEMALLLDCMIALLDAPTG